MPKKNNLVLFDLDNTLVDFTGNAYKSMLATVGERLDGVGFDDFWAVYVPNAIAAWEAYSRGELGRGEMRDLRLGKSLAHFGLPLINIRELNERYVRLLIDLTDRPIEGAAKALAELKNSGRRLGIITNGFIDIARQRIEHSGLAGFFEHVVVSEELGIHKPHPGIFEHTLRLFDTDKDDTLYIGDNIEFDITGAAAADIRGILFAPEEIPQEAIAAAIPVFRHYDELPALVESI